MFYNIIQVIHLNDNLQTTATCGSNQQSQEEKRYIWLYNQRDYMDNKHH